jgi:hypothetical protein
MLRGCTQVESTLLYHTLINGDISPVLSPKIPLAAQPPMVYDIAGSHSQYESAKIWNEFRLTHENNREDLVYDRSERKDSTAG